MKICATPSEFTTHSLQLYRARPHTTKTTTTYHSSTQGKGHLRIKTWDPVSGAVIQFKTNKIADVGRTVAALGRIARGSLGMEVKEEATETKDEAGDVKMTDALAEAVEKTSATVAAASEQPQASQGGKKKKGKGKGKK